MNAADEAKLDALLSALVRIDSISGTEDAAANALASWGLDHGLDARIETVGLGRSSAVLSYSFRSGPSVLFSGHIDTLAPPASAKSPVVGRQGDRFFGPEINNMKAAVAAMAIALLRLRDEGIPGSVTLLAAASECDTIGLGTLAALRAGLNADAAINGEPTDLRILTGHGGVGRVRIVARGIAAHVSKVGQGQNAIDGLVRALTGMDASALNVTAHPAYPGLPNFNIGLISGGVAASVSAPEAVAEIDIRWPPGANWGSIVEALRSFVLGATSGSGVDVSVEPLAEPEFMQPSSFESRPEWGVVKAVAAAHSAVTGQTCEAGVFSPQYFFGSDAPHLVDAGIPTCMYGPGTMADLNSTQESVAWEDVVTASEVYREAAKAILLSETQVAQLRYQKATII